MATATKRKVGDRVKVKGRGSKVFRVRNVNANAVEVESTTGDYEVTWAALDTVTKASGKGKDDDADSGDDAPPEPSGDDADDDDDK
jgi:hypothetical protein